MNPLLEFEAEVGTTVIQTAIGLSGHPGLVGEIYKLPVHVPGMYRVTTVTDEIERRKKITLLAFGCTDATIGDKAAPYVA
ncbi:MAG: hypothetical protein NTY98_14160, partial [Verrucomicrobia bacterium]|nr:hypothetical protein [Verrucomicrobiota bacterium]